MVSYPQLEYYLEMPPPPIDHPAESPASEMIRQLIGEVKNEPPLPLLEAFMFDLVSTQSVFDGLGFERGKLWSLAQRTQLLPRQIIGINSLRIMYIHNPCIQKLGEHVSHLTQKEKNKVQKSMRIIAHIRGQLRKFGIGGQGTAEDILQRIIHRHMCQRMKLPTN